MTQDKVLVWAGPNCSYCEKAFDLIKAKLGHISIDYRIVGQGYYWTKEQFIEANPGKRTVPQIYINDKYIGGYTELVEYFKQ